MKNIGLAVTVSMVAIGLAPCAHAQAQIATDAEADAGTDIVVTALRRDERLQDVPVSITAIGGDALQQQRIESVSALATLVPNLQATSPTGEGVPIFALRGVTMNDTSPTNQGPIATYFDEVYKGSSILIPLGIYDLERVEVLRGPQGTLYGKNTTGGAINFISRKPGYTPEANLLVGYGNYNRWEASGAAQAGLSDKVAARVAFTYTSADGWFKNLTPGQANANELHQYAVRGTLLFEPSDTFTAIIRASTSLQNPRNYGTIFYPGPGGSGAFGYGLCAITPGCISPAPYDRTGMGPREGNLGVVPRNVHRTSDVSLTLNWRVADGLSLTSISSYDYGSLSIPQNTDGSVFQTVDFNVVYGKARQFSQDLRLASDSSGPFNFILGGYFNREKIAGNYDYVFYGDIDFDGNGTVDAADCTFGFFACRYKTEYIQVKKSIAAYADLKYQLTDRLVLRGGIRFTHDTGRYDYHADINGVDGTFIRDLISGADQGNAGRFFQQGFSTNNVSGKIGIDFNIDRDHMIYASFSRGYRGSAFNNQGVAPGELTIAKPEILYAYELGFKTQWLDSRLTLNGAVFHYFYENQQALSLSSDGLNRLINIPKATINGAELELAFRPIRTLRFNAGIGYNDSEVKEGEVGGISLVGKRLSNSSKFSANASVNWDFAQTDFGTFRVGGSVSYMSKRYFDLPNTELTAQDGFALVDAQLQFRTSNDRYGITLWGKNLTDKYYFNATYDVTAAFGGYGGSLGAPRTYGVSVDARF